MRVKLKYGITPENFEKMYRIENEMYRLGVRILGTGYDSTRKCRDLLMDEMYTDRAIDVLLAGGIQDISPVLLESLPLRRHKKHG